MRLSRQTVIAARKHLAERKLISFIEGKSGHVPSKYTMLEWTDDLTNNLTDGLTHDLTLVKDKDKELSIWKSSENFNSKNGSSKQKENRGICPVSTEGADYDSTFRLPVNEEKAYELLLAAVIAEVQFRHRKFVYNEFIDNQLRQIAKWLTTGSSKFGMVLVMV